MNKRVLFSLLIAVCVVVLDQVTKYLARTHIGAGETIELLPLVNLVNVRNQGAAFGMFRSLGNPFFITLSAAAIVVMSWIIVKGKEDHRIFALLAGGALFGFVGVLLALPATAVLAVLLRHAMARWRESDLYGQP